MSFLLNKSISLTLNKNNYLLVNICVLLLFLVNLLVVNAVNLTESSSSGIGNISLSFEEENQDNLQFNENYVATTPKIVEMKPLSRYEQGLEDYEEAVEHVQKEIEIKITKQNQENSPWMALFEIVTKGIMENYFKTKNEVKSISSTNIDNNNNNINAIGYRRDDTKDKSVVSSNNVTKMTLNNEAQNNYIIKNTNNESNENNKSISVNEGRYIKGDPLNGYYDFIITEGSYKFWSAFQLATAALIIYSTFAAIYYSKVNPLTGDYDYIDYLNGRSLSDDGDISTGDNSYWSSVVNADWIGSASHAFQFVLDAIDRVPQ